MNKNIATVITVTIVLGALVLAYQHTISSGDNWVVSAKIIKPYNPGGPKIGSCTSMIEIPM